MVYLLRLQNTLSRAGIIVSSADGEACSRQFDHRRVMFVGRSAAPTPTKGLADKKSFLARFLLFAREERCLFHRSAGLSSCESQCVVFVSCSSQGGAPPPSHDLYSLCTTHIDLDLRMYLRDAVRLDYVKAGRREEEGGQKRLLCTYLSSTWPRYVHEK